MKNKKRVFLGIDIPEDLKIEITNQPFFGKGLGGWVQKEDLHITLLFLGEVSEDEVEKIISTLESIKFSKLTISTEDFSFFHQRIFYLSVLKTEELLHWKEKIDLHFVKGEGEKRFSPHITLRRLHQKRFQETKAMIEGVSPLMVSFNAVGVTLFKSDPTSPGLKYERLYTKHAE